MFPSMYLRWPKWLKIGQILPLRKNRALHQPKQGLATIAIFHTGMSQTFELKRQPCSTLYMDLKRAIHLAWHLKGPCMGQLGPGLLGVNKAKIKAKASLQQHGNRSIISSLKICPRRKLGQLGKLQNFEKIFLIFTYCTFRRPNLITWTKFSK